MDDNIICISIYFKRKKLKYLIMKNKTYKALREKINYLK